LGTTTKYRIADSTVDIETGYYRNIRLVEQREWSTAGRTTSKWSN